MALTVTPQPRRFVAVIDGVDLSSDLSSEKAAQMLSAAAPHPVLIFPNQPLNDFGLITFAAHFGALEVMASVTPKGSWSSKVAQDARMEEAAKYVVDVSNMDDKDVILNAGDPRRKIYDGSRAWHSDCTYREISASFSFLLSRVTPPSGGETEYADMTAAYDALPQSMKTTIDGLEGEHSVIYSAGLTGYHEWTDEQRARLAPRRRPLVRVHPVTGRKSLLLASHLSNIIGWSDIEARKLIKELTEFATQPRFVYSHHWNVGDLVVWDNRCLMHRGMPYASDQHRRRLRSVRVTERIQAGDDVRML